MSDRENRIALTRKLLLQRYPAYNSLPNGERVLLAASVLVNDYKVREQGTNSGPWVEAFLAGVQLGKGYPWCAAFIEFCCDVADASWGPADRASAAVISWKNAAKRDERNRVKPARGRLCLYVKADGTGHIGIVAGVMENGKVISYEGNTSSGEAGSQRDGDGAYRRIRPASKWQMYVEIDEIPD
jgi:hypothetical protein